MSRRPLDKIELPYRLFFSDLGAVLWLSMALLLAADDWFLYTESFGNRGGAV